jgi:hypothetical protein
MGQKIRGLVGQGMVGRRQNRTALIAVTDSRTSGSFTVPASCTAYIYGVGGGASGAGGGGGATGGGGGGAGFRLWDLTASQIVSWSAGAGGAGVAGPGPGNNGGDSAIVVPGLGILVAGGGMSGAGGLCSGLWDIARVGGAGGTMVNGASPTGGGIGGLGSSPYGGGGASAGFSDLVPGLLIGGDGGNANTSTFVTLGAGGGSGASSIDSASGKSGRILVYFIRTTT